MKRIITLLLTLAMTFSLAMPAQAASTKASTMRLMDTVGTATVENAAGKNLSIKDNMRLYNGYEVATKDASYAYISLDSSKAVKLDASSAVKVNQSGKKLELDVTAGELMFNVPVALKSDESLNIRTSTMVTGIRGTAGWVNALDRYTTRVAVLEGAVTINSQDPFTGADRAVTITGGQIATIIRHERANAIQQQLMDDGVIIEENIIAELTKPGQIVEEIQEADIPGFVAQEVSSNSDLQDRISEESPLNVDEIIKDAQQRLNEEEKVAEKQNKIIEEKLKLLSATNPGLPFATPEVIVQTNTVTERIEVEENVPSGLDDPKTMDVKTVLEAIGIAAVTNAGSNFDITELEMDDSDTLYIIGGNILIDEPWTVRGKITVLEGVTVTNTSTITVEGTLDIGSGASMTNNGTININSTNSLEIGGCLDNFGTICVGYDAKGKLLVESTGALYNGSEDNPTGSISVSNAYGESTLENYGLVTNYAVLENDSRMENHGYFYNLRSYQADEEEYAESQEILDEEENSIFGVVRNTGMIFNYGALENWADFYNSGVISTDNFDDYDDPENTIHAFTQCAGVLHMTGGTIRAGGNANALYYRGGSLNITQGEIFSHGYAGFALLLNQYCSEFVIPGNSTAVLKSDDMYSLIGTNQDTSDWGVHYSYYNYYDGPSSPCYSCEHPVISIGHYRQPSLCYHYYYADDYYYVDLSSGKVHRYE